MDPMRATLHELRAEPSLEHHTRAPEGGGNGRYAATMPSLAARRQAGLFASATDLFDPASTLVEPPPPDLVACTRAELQATLIRAEVAESLPWVDLTAAILAELRFRGILHWLIQAEAAELRARFNAAMNRLYAAAGEA